MMGTASTVTPNALVASPVVAVEPTAEGAACAESGSGGAGPVGAGVDEASGLGASFALTSTGLSSSVHTSASGVPVAVARARSFDLSPSAIKGDPRTDGDMITKDNWRRQVTVAAGSVSTERADEPR